MINISLLSFILINLRIYDIHHTHPQVKLIYNDSVEYLKKNLIPQALCEDIYDLIIGRDVSRSKITL